MKKLKLTNVIEQELKEKAMRKITGGKNHVCKDSDGCGSTSNTGSKYGTDMEAEMDDYNNQR